MSRDIPCANAKKGLINFAAVNENRFDSSKHAWDRKNRKGMARSVASCYDKFEIVSTGNIVSVDDIIPFAFSILSCRASR